MASLRDHQCSLFALIAHSWPATLLTLRASYHLYSKRVAGMVCERLIFFSRRKVSLLWLSQQVHKTTHDLSESLHNSRHGIAEQATYPQPPGI